MVKGDLIIKGFEGLMLKGGCGGASLTNKELGTSFDVLGKLNARFSRFEDLLTLPVNV